METKKTSETLEEGFLGCGNLNEKCASDHLSNVEFDGELGNQRITKSLVGSGIAGNDHRNKETLGSNGGEAKDNDVPVCEGDFGSKITNGTRIQVEESMERRVDLLRGPELTAIEVPGKGINLFVEVFGPLDGMSESNDYPSCNKGEDMAGGGETDKECSSKEYGVVSFYVKRKSNKNGDEGGVGGLEHIFNVGDLVWVKTRSGMWWPGIVPEPSNATSGATKFEKRASFLVKYFGIAKLVWCSNLELKPFIEYYDQMSRQSNSRNFVSSVEKALCEIGQRVKWNMTCRCFPKEVECKDSSSVSADDNHRADALSLSQFEPAGFVACIRDLARSVHTLDKIELTVMKNCLSAFYCSIGHHELPLQLLRSSSDEAENGKNRMTPELMDEDHKHSVKTRNDGHYALRRGKRSCTYDAGRVPDGKITSPRERKKSKYLAYPYVDINDRHNTKSTVEKEKEKDDSADHSTSSKKSTPGARNQGTSSHKRESRKPSKGCDVVIKATNTNASSAELLVELCSTARDCFHICGSKHAGALTGFLSGFRNFAFLNADKASKVYRDQQEPNGVECIVQNLSEAKVLSEGIKEVKASRKQRVNCESVKKAVNKVVDVLVSKTNDPEAKGSGRRRRTNKNKEHIISTSLQSTGNHVGKVRNDNLISSCVISLRQTCSDVHKNETAPEKIDGGSKQSTSSCVGTDKKDYPKNSSMISFQQTGSDVPEKGTAPEKSEGHAEQSTGICLRTCKNNNPNSSCVISFQQTPLDVPKGGTSLEKTEGSDPLLPQINSVPQLPDLNGKHPIESVNQLPSGGPSTDLGKPVTNLSGSHQGKSVEQILSEGRPSADISKPVTSLGKKGLAIKNVSGIQQTALALFPSLKDTSIPILQNIRNNPVNSTQLYQNAEFAARELDTNASTNARIISFVQPSHPMVPFPTVGKTEQNERKRKQKTRQSSSDIPDLNGNALYTSSPGKTLVEGIPLSPDGMLPQKKGKHKSSTAESVSKGKMKINDPGGSLLLNFVKGSTLPSKEMLVAKFSRFGLLKESEIQVIDDSCVQIVYERSPDAKFAFRSLEKISPFGDALIDFKLRCAEAAAKPTLKKKKFQIPQPILPLEVHKNLAKPVETPDLAVMRQNVEMMKLTLERAGNTISPEMRSKLESEIKGFLDKINTVGGSLSSS